MIVMYYLLLGVWFKRCVERHHPFQHPWRLEQRVGIIHTRFSSQSYKYYIAVSSILHYYHCLQTPQPKQTIYQSFSQYWNTCLFPLPISAQNSMVPQAGKSFKNISVLVFVFSSDLWQFVMVLLRVLFDLFSQAGEAVVCRNLFLVFHKIILDSKWNSTVPGHTLHQIWHKTTHYSELVLFSQYFFLMIEAHYGVLYLCIVRCVSLP